MAGVYDVLGAFPKLDFSPLGKIVPAYQAGLENYRQDQIRQAFAGGLPRGAGGAIDFNAAADIAARAGGLGQIPAFANLANAQAERAQASAALAETIRSHRAHEALTLKGMEEKPQYMKWTDADGNEQIVLLKPLGTGATLVKPEGAPTAPTNPYAPTRKMTAEEAQTTGFSDRMANSHMIIRGLEHLNDDTTGYLTGLITGNESVANNPLVNTLLTPDRQSLLQAQRDFINAQLRRESGMAISKSEFTNATRQYLPVPGDSQKVLDQKRRNRELATEAMFQGAGRGYKPPGTYIGSKGPVLAPSAPAAPAAAAAPGAIPEEAITQFRANRNKVGEAEKFDAAFGVGSAARVLGVTP